MEWGRSAAAVIKPSAFLEGGRAVLKSTKRLSTARPNQFPCEGESDKEVLIGVRIFGKPNWCHDQPAKSFGDVSARRLILDLKDHHK